MNTASEHLDGLLIALEHRIRDCRDWVRKKPLPQGAYVCAEVIENNDFAGVSVRISFESYDEAMKWAATHTTCYDDNYGFAARDWSEFNPGTATSYIWIPMPDFHISLCFPTSTHPDARHEAATV